MDTVAPTKQTPTPFPGTNFWRWVPAQGIVSWYCGCVTQQDDMRGCAGGLVHGRGPDVYHSVLSGPHGPLQWHVLESSGTSAGVLWWRCRCAILTYVGTSSYKPACQKVKNNNTTYYVPYDKVLNLACDPKEQKNLDLYIIQIQQ